MKWGNWFLAALCLSVIAVPLTGSSAPSITISTDKIGYVGGETIEVSLAAENSGEPISVDAYIGLIMPWGGIYTYSADVWHDALVPWLEDIPIADPFLFEETPLFWFVVPEGIEGDFQFAAVLTHQDIFEFASDVSFAPFTIGTEEPSDFYVDALLGDDANDGSEAYPWRTISHALESTEGSEDNPKTIHVASGTYSASESGESFPLNTKSWVSLTGENLETTILDAEDAAYHVINCDFATDLVIEGLTLKRGNAVGESGYDNIGGGILCAHGASPIIHNNIIAECKANAGGAIYSSDSTPTINGNVITSCSSKGSGGAISLYLRSGVVTSNLISDNTAGTSGGAISSFDCDVLIEDNSVLDNDSLGVEAAGGAIVCQDCAATFRDNDIKDNTSACDGGGVLLTGVEEFIVENNTISGNSCSGRGGGVSLTGCVAPIVENNDIDNNTAGWMGGGVYCSGAESFTLLNNALSGNGADDSGGAVMLWGVTGTILIEDNLITGGSAGQNGGGIFFLETSGVVRNNEIMENTSGCDGGGIACHSSSPEIVDNTISNNTSNAPAGSGGGAIALNMSDSDVHDNLISDNWCANGGGGMHICCDSTATIHENEFTRNHAEFMGGGIACYGASPTIENNWFTENTAGWNGGAVYVSRDSEATIEGNTMQDNFAAEGGDDVFHEGD